MKHRRLWVSLIILGGLALYIGGYEVYWKNHRAKAEKEAKRLVPFKAEDIQTISLKKGKDGTEIVLRRDDTGWKIVAPKEYEADSVEADSLASRLADFSYTQELKGGRDEDYGLTSPRIIVEVKSKSGGVARFEVGNDAPVGFSLYIKKGAQTVLADQGIYRDLDKPLSEFRRKKLFNFMTPDVISVELVDGTTGKKTVLTKENGAWRLKEPFAFPADRNTVENTLRSLEFAEFTDFAAEGTTPESVGLKPPLYTATVTTKPPAEATKGKKKSESAERVETQEAYFGKEDTGHWYALRKGSSEIGFLAPDRKKDIFRDPADYKRRTIADFSEFDATYLKAVLGKETIEFERKGGLGAEKWFLKGTHQEIAFSDIGYVFDFIVGTRLDKVLNLGGNPKDYGLDQPKASLTVKDETGKVLCDAVIGEKDGKYYANVKGEDIAFEVREEQYKSLESRIRLMKTPGKKEPEKK